MKINVIIGILVSVVLVSCGGSSNEVNTAQKEIVPEVKVVEKLDPMSDFGVGPISSITINELDNEMAEKGKSIYETNCTACHKMGKRFVGPNLVGITHRRTPEWIMNMILAPDRMVKENQAAKELLMEYSAPMANQSLEEDQARAIYEYLRTVES